MWPIFFKNWLLRVCLCLDRHLFPKLKQGLLSGWIATGMVVRRDGL
jgi:hypothetical protein